MLTPLFSADDPFPKGGKGTIADLRKEHLKLLQGQIDHLLEDGARFSAGRLGQLAVAVSNAMKGNSGMMREQMIRNSVARLTGAEPESIGVLAGLNLTIICGLGVPSAREALRIEQALRNELGPGSINPGMVRFV